MDDIWDEPAVAASSIPRTQEPLFLTSDDERPTAPSRPKPSQENGQEDDMDDIFAEFEDLIGPVKIAAPLDVDALIANRRRAAGIENSASSTQGGASKISSTTKDALNDPEDDKPKPKRTIAKVDDERLLGERGFPALITEAKKFKPQGKGHEAADLERLMHMYQFWSHRMFPKTQFKDTVDRVERVCRSRRMLINLSMWRDAAQNPLEDGKDQQIEDSDSDIQVLSALNNQEKAIIQKASSPVENLDDAIDAIMAEGNQTSKKQQKGNNDLDEDDLEDWFNLDDVISVPVPVPKAAQSQQLPDDMELDEEIETALERTKSDLAAAARGERHFSPMGDDDFDDLYA